MGAAARGEEVRDYAANTPGPYFAVASAVMGKQVVAAEYWRHQSSGCVWAVSLVNGDVIGACGPIDDRDATRKLLHYLPYTARDAAWVNRSRDAFVAEPRYGRI